MAWGSEPAQDEYRGAIGVATASIVFGVLGFVTPFPAILLGFPQLLWGSILSPILALAFGYTARGRIRHQGGSGRALRRARIGVWLGWVNIFLTVGLIVWGIYLLNHTPTCIFMECE